MQHNGLSKIKQSPVELVSVMLHIWQQHLLLIYVSEVLCDICFWKIGLQLKKCYNVDNMKFEVLAVMTRRSPSFGL
jgi:hypothetical protein